MLTTRKAAGAAVLLAALLAAASASAAPTTGACSPTKVKFIASSGLFQVDSTGFTNAPQAAVTFVQGGNRASCVIVNVSAQPIASGGGVLTVRVVLDSNQAALPAAVSFSDGNDSGNQVRSFDFIFPSVTPGAHTVRLQFKTSDPTQFTDLNRHNIIVHYAR